MSKEKTLFQEIAALYADGEEDIKVIHKRTKEIADVLRIGFDGIEVKGSPHQKHIDSLRWQIHKPQKSISLAEAIKEIDGAAVRAGHMENDTMVFEAVNAKTILAKVTTNNADKAVEMTDALIGAWEMASAEEEEEDGRLQMRVVKDLQEIRNLLTS